MRPFEKRLLVFYIIMGHQLPLIHSETFDESENAMLLQEIGGFHLRLTAFSDPPWFNILEEHSNGTISCTGFTPNVADYLAKALNITYSFIRIPTHEVNAFGPKEASINMLMRNEVDVTRLVGLNLDHYTRIDCSIPLYNERSEMMVPWPEVESRILTPIRPFDGKVWIVLTLSTIAVSFTLSWLQKFYSITNLHNPASSFKDDDTTFILNYINTGKFYWSPWNNKLSIRIVQGSWCLAAVVLFNAYSTTLMSYLVAPKLMPVVRTYADIVSATRPQNLKLLTEKNEILADYSLRATSGTYKALGDLLRKYPESLFTNRQKGFELMFTGQYAYPATGTRVSVFMDWAYKRAGHQCRFTVSNWNLARQFSVVWTFVKNWRYTEIINRKLRYFSESGLAYFWLKQATPSQASQCYLENYKAGSSTKPKVLTLTDLIGPFAFLIAGSSLSFFIFLLEKMCFSKA